MGATGASLSVAGAAVGQEQPDAEVEFETQVSDGTSVTVTSATLSEGGFISIHDDRALDAEFVESVIGVSEYLEAGSYENVEVTLFQNVDGAEFEQRTLEGVTQLFAMPQLDTDGDRTFTYVASNSQFDGPYTENDRPIVDDATVSVDEQVPAWVVFEDQTVSGSTVSVDSAMLSEGGFVTIHDSALLEGNVVGSVIGVSDYLQSGTHEQLTVELFDVPGGEFSESTITGEQQLIAMPHQDTDGNQTYDFLISQGQADGPYAIEGEPIVDTATVTAGEGESTPDESGEKEETTDQQDSSTAGICFRDQTSDGTTVAVQSATLPEGGYVVIHDSTLQEGNTVGSTIGVSAHLEPGTHEGITVSLFQGIEDGTFSRQRLDGDGLLIAMPHRDTDDTQSFGFVASDGEVDGPYTTDGGPVTDEAMITVEGGTDTPTGNETTPTGNETTPTGNETTPTGNETGTSGGTGTPGGQGTPGSTGTGTSDGTGTQSP